MIQYKYWFSDCCNISDSSVFANLFNHCLPFLLGFFMTLIFSFLLDILPPSYSSFLFSFLSKIFLSFFLSIIFSPTISYSFLTFSLFMLPNFVFLYIYSLFPNSRSSFLYNVASFSQYFFLLYYSFLFPSLVSLSRIPSCFVFFRLFPTVLVIYFFFSILLFPSL